MFCTKCNSEIPDGAKFCASCGEPVNSKKFCVKCGTELAGNMKFCSACGTPVSAENTADIYQTVRLDQINKAPASVSEVFGGFEAEQPTFNSVPRPVSDERPVLSYVAAATSVAPSFSGTTAPQTANVVSNSAEAAVVRKKSKKPVVIIVVIAVLVLALLGGGIFYFTNKATVLSTFMGKANYAAMVEGNSLKQVADKIDAGLISGGVKTSTELFYTVYNQLGSVNADDFMGMSDNSSNGLTAYFSALSNAVKDVYGTNSVVLTAGMKAELTDMAKSELLDEFYISEDQLDEILDYINNSKFTFGLTAGDDSAAFTAGAEVDGLKVDVKVIENDKGEAYIVFPFATDKAIMVNIGDELDLDFDAVETANAEGLELEEKEIERFINEIVELYIENYKSSEIEMENGELSASGVSVSGKVLTAEFDSDMIEKMITDFAEKLAGDEYFKGKIVDYLNKCGADITEEDYEEKILDAFSDIDVPDELELKITTVINNSGDILGKSYELTYDKKDMLSVSFAENGNESAVQLDYSEHERTSGLTQTISAKNTAENAGTGTMTIKYSAKSGDKKQSCGITVDYKDVKTEKFGNKDVSTGSFEVKVDLPEDFAEESGLPANSAEILAGLKLSFSSSVDGNTCKSAFGLQSDKLGDYEFNLDVTAKDDNSALSVPSDVIDITPYINSGDEPDEAFKDEFIRYLETIRDAIANQNAGEAGSSLSDAIDEMISEADSVSDDEIDALLDDIETEYNNAYDYYIGFEVYNEQLNNDISDFMNDCVDLYNDVYGAYYYNDNISSTDFSEYKSRFDELKQAFVGIQQTYSNAQTA